MAASTFQHAAGITIRVRVDCWSLFSIVVVLVVVVVVASSKSVYWESKFSRNEILIAF